MAWGLRESWAAAARVCAAAWDVDEALITAPSRGRGPRPPVAAREPRIVAMHLAIVLSGREYAALARLLAMHKDTVSSHCATVRARIETDAAFEALSDGLERACAQALGEPARAEARRAHRRIERSEPCLERVGRMNAPLSDERPSSDERRSSDDFAPSSDEFARRVA